MTPAAMVLVCAIQLLGRNPESFPPIELLDVRPPYASVNAEGFVDPRTSTIYILTTTAVFRAALQAQGRCGSTEPLRKLASILVHEEWHVLHGSDEEGAYAAQLTTLTMLGGPDSPLFNSVRRSMVAVLAQQRTARTNFVARR